MHLRLFSAIVFYVFPEPPWSLMNSGGGDCLACSTKCSETWARWPVGGGRAPSVTASPLLRWLTLLRLQQALVSVSKSGELCFLEGMRRLEMSHRRLLLSASTTHGIYQREKQLSPPEPGIALRGRSGELRQDEVSCSVPWVGSGIRASSHGMRALHCGRD